MSSREFFQFEYAGWERAAEHYGEGFGGVTTQAAEPILDAAGVESRTRVLDVACGPGFVAAAAAARGADVVGLDFSPAMIALAQREHPAIIFREGDAATLPFGDMSFDAVVMNFGLLHLAEPEAALAEAHRVLRPNGRYALTVWASPDHAVGFGIALRAIEVCGTLDAPIPAGPAFFRFSDADECRRTLAQAGFHDIAVRTMPLTWRVPSADAVFNALARGSVRTAALLRAQTPDALTAIRDSIRQALSGYARDGLLDVPMPAVLAVGTA